MKIVGTSGVSLLLAAQFMRRYDPLVCIKEQELINNHTAVLRFKDEKISEFLNIPFDKVTIDKAIVFEGEMYTTSNLRLQNMYSQKVTGNVLDRSIRDLNSEIRYIAPDNFFDLLKVGLNIKTGCNLMEELFNNPNKEEILSYVKMPEVMDYLKVEKPEFSFSPVYTINVKLISPKVKVYQTIYYPGKEDYYRASITKDNLIVEFIREPENIPYLLDEILSDFGLTRYELGDIKMNILPLGKMNPIEEKCRKQFISKLTKEYNIYSFGRNGVWKSIRLDSVFQDLHKIDRCIRSGGYGII